MPDLVFDKYEIIRRLAVGGMGEIFLARQHGIPGFDRLVILKNLLPELASQQGFIDQFLDEARVAATLNHPNIVAIYEVGKWEGVYFIAMEYIHGCSLSELITALVRSERVVPPAVAARIIMDAAVGLDHAHSATDTQGNELKIVHRDISPQNIMVRKDGVTKVVDFGIAKAANRSARTATGQVKGKLGYMSPEQIGERPLDGRTDQFALGVVFWELCAGTRLMGSSNVAITINKILNEPIAPVSERVKGFPPALDAVMLRMLSKSRDKRYARCLDAGQDLKAYLDTVSGDIGQVDVARLVESAAGLKIDEKTADLTPTGDNFLISLTGDDSTVEVTTGKTSKPRKPVIAAAMALLVAAVAAGTWILAGSDAFDGPGPAPAVLDAPKAEPVTAEPAPAKGTTILDLSSEPPGAGVFVGTRVLGNTPIRMATLAPGVEHTITLEKRGFDSAELKVNLKAGETRTEKMTLTKKAVRRSPRSTAAKAESRPPPRALPAVSKPGHITVQTKPYTMVYFRGRLLGETPLYNYELPAGTHTLRLVNEREKIDQKRKVTVRANKVAKLKVVFGE